MYIIGNYATAPILTVNPNLNLGMFSLPASNNEEENKLVSGIDVYFAIPKDCKNKEESIRKKGSSTIMTEIDFKFNNVTKYKRKSIVKNKYGKCYLLLSKYLSLI